MSTTADLLLRARTEGVWVDLNQDGTLRVRGDQTVVSRWLPVLREHKHSILAELGHSRPTGDIPLGTVQAFEAAAIAREAEDLKEAFEERAGILEHDAGLPRAEAELEAARITATYARNRGSLWASLRAALADYLVLLAQVPDGPGPIDSLPFGTARVHVRESAKLGLVSGSIAITEAEIEAARKGQRVVRQGTFTGAQEVKG